MKKLFEKGKPLERLHPLYDMVETMLFVKPEKTGGGAHIRDHFDIKRMMFFVIIAGLPAFFFGIYNTGYQYFASAGISPGIIECFVIGAETVIPLLLVVYAVGGFWEVLFAVIRRHEVSEGFFVTGFLIVLILPATIPLWQVVVAVSFGVVLGKEVFGGSGMNIFNPALVTRAFLFFAYPASISGDGIWNLSAGPLADTYTAATPLSIALVNTEAGVVDALNSAGYDFTTMFLGLMPGSIGETSTLAILAGGAFLLATGIASWRVMLSVFAGGILTVFLMNYLSPSPASMMALPPHYHMAAGAFAFGAVFMATDPVSSAATNTGKYIYGFMIGVLAITVRVLNPAYPEGMMLAILFMNAFAPLIDEAVLRAGVIRRRKRAAG